MFIKFAFRGNLRYPFLLMVWHYVRQLVVDFITLQFDFENSLSYTPIVFFAEFIGGLTFYILQQLSFKRKRVEKDHYFTFIKLIQNKGKNGLAPADNYFKIAFIIFVTSYIDLAQFLYWAINIPKFPNISTTLTFRLIGFSTIAVAIYYIYILKLPIYKHHKFSLIVIGICLAITLVSEYFFQQYDIFLSRVKFCKALGFILFKHICAPIVDLLEKYLFEYDYMDPFLVLMYEGLIGIAISCLLFLTPNYLDDFLLVFKKNKDNPWKIVLFVFLIILYIILSALRNAFKMITTKLFSPMTRNLTDNILTPLYLIYYLGISDDFEYEGKMDYIYFTINLILSIIILICSFIYSEIIILFCCGLETNTHDQISERAALVGFGSICELQNKDGESARTEDYSIISDDNSEKF